MTRGGQPLGRAGRPGFRHGRLLLVSLPRLPQLPLLPPLPLLLLPLLLLASGCDSSDQPHAPSHSALLELSRASQRLAATVSPAVVRIDAGQFAENGKADEELAQLFGEIREPTSQGSGIVVSADGLILTNYHVVRNAELTRVTLDEQRTVTGQIVGVDALTDLALVQVPVQGLDVAPWGNSDKLEPGEFVWVIGNPFGLQRSITFGILSARQGGGVTKSPYYDFLQTDAVVNPGNSGGPLVNSRGEIVGVTTTILGATYQGVSFAIPSRTAREVVEQLRQRGKVMRGWIGASLAPIDVERARQLGLKRPQGVYVQALVSGAGGSGPAATAGVRPGDVIQQWNGQEVDGVATLARQIASAPIGAQIRLTLFRDGQTLSLPVQVAEHP
jgi:S1-C subfamily serine protease